MPLPPELQEAFSADAADSLAKRNRSFVIFLSMFSFMVLLIAGFFAYLYLSQKTTVPPRGTLIRNNTVDYLHLFSKQYEIGYSTPTGTVFYAIKDIKNPSYDQMIPYLSTIDAIFSDGAISMGFNLHFPSGQQIKVGAAGNVVITNFSGQITQIEWILKSNFLHLLDASGTEIDICTPDYMPTAQVINNVATIKTEGVLTLNLRMIYTDNTFEDRMNPSNTSFTIIPSKKLKALQWLSPLQAESQTRVMQERLVAKPASVPIPIGK